MTLARARASGQAVAEQSQDTLLIRLNKVSLDPADSVIYRGRLVDGVEGIVDCVYMK